VKALLVARKSLREMVREPQLLGLTLLLPLVFLGVTAFSYNAPLLATYPLSVVNSGPQGVSLVEELEAERHSNGRPVFEVTLTADRETAEADLKERKVVALVVIAEETAGEVGQPGQAAEEVQRLAVTIKGDAVYPRFYRASAILEEVISRYGDRVVGRPEMVRIIEGALRADSRTSIASAPEGAVTVGPQTEFDIYAPGMMVFAWLMIIPQTAMLVAREIRWGTLRRLRLTALRSFDLLGGMSLAQMVVAAVQVVVVFLAARLMGFHSQGSLGIATLVGLVISFSAVGLGLLVACLVENDSQAANLGSTIAMIQVFLSGSFYQLPPLTIFTLAGHQIDLFDIFPVTHGFLALQQVLSYGADLSEVGFRLGAALLLSILYLGAGVILFQRLQMRAAA
jgi:ABC-2 type transport system permease protein